MSDRGTQLFEELMRFRPEGLSANAWAVKAGVSRAFWNDLKRHGNPSRRTLEKLLGAADSSLAEFEALRVDAGPSALEPNFSEYLGEAGGRWRAAPIAPLPVVATEGAGEWGQSGGQIELLRIDRREIVGRLARPASLASDAAAYAVTVIGDSMWPRFRPGRRLAVSPAAPVAIGDDVLVLLRESAAGAGQQALAKELVRRSAAVLELRQFNPNVTFAVGMEKVESVHKIAGELI